MKPSFRRARLWIGAAVGSVAFVLALTLSAEAQAASITPTTLPSAQVNSFYSTALQLNDLATTTSLIWSIPNNTFPPGLTIEMLNNGQSARITGRPILATNASFQIQLMNGSQVVYEQPYTLLVRPAGATTTDPFLIPRGQANNPFSYTFPMPNGTAPFTWTVTSGTLPTGFTLTSNGVFSGTPTASGTTWFTVQARDALGGITFYPLSYSVDASASLMITSTSLPNGMVGTNYSVQLQSSGGQPNYTWMVTSGSLPPGLIFGGNGTLQGTPTTAGTYTVTLTSMDANASTTSRQYTFSINPRSSPSLVISNTQLGSGTVGTFYSTYLGASGGSSPYTWRVVSGALPGGLTFGSNGALTGIPTGSGTYNFTLEAMDAQGNRVTQPYQFAIQANTAANPAELDARLQTLRSLGIDMHSLIKLPDDRNPATQQDSAVYYIGTDGRRHAFPHERVFFSWFGNFLNVRTVSASVLAQIPLGSNVTYKPGTHMVKFLSDSKVYAISRNRELRWIPTETMAQSIYGSNWNRSVADVPSVFMPDYAFGADINFSSEYVPSTVLNSVNSISDTLPVL